MKDKFNYLVAFGVFRGGAALGLVGDEEGEVGEREVEAAVAAGQHVAAATPRCWRLCN